VVKSLILVQANQGNMYSQTTEENIETKICPEKPKN
jgi:hypothetical protein